MRMQTKVTSKMPAVLATLWYNIAFQTQTPSVNCLSHHTPRFP